jgi:hypothetical protein
MDAANNVGAPLRNNADYQFFNHFIFLFFNLQFRSSIRRSTKPPAPPHLHIDKPNQGPRLWLPLDFPN